MYPAIDFLMICGKVVLNGRRQWHPTPVLLPGKSHGQRSLVGCSPWGVQEWDMTERRHFQFSLSRIGEGNGNSLQCSCLENPRDGGAWWAAIYGVAQSRTRLKQLSSSSSSTQCLKKKKKKSISTHSFVIVLKIIPSFGHFFLSLQSNDRMNSRSFLINTIYSLLRNITFCSRQNNIPHAHTLHTK